MDTGKDYGLILQNGCYDLEYKDNDFIEDGGLETSIIISLFSNKRISEDQRQELSLRELGGWWGSSLIDPDSDEVGSRFWVLTRAKATIETLRLIEDYAMEALNYLIEDGVASSIEVNASYNQGLTLNLEIQIFRPFNEVSKFSILWDNQLRTILNFRSL